VDRKSREMTYSESEHRNRKVIVTSNF